MKINVKYVEDSITIPIRTTNQIHPKHTLGAVQTILEDIIAETREMYNGNEDVNLFFTMSKLEGVVNFIKDVIEREYNGNN